MKVEILSIENQKYGKKFYIRYKKYLFWHTVFWDDTPDGKTPVTDWYYPLDLTRYFERYEDAEEYVNINILPPKIKIIRSFKK